MSLAVIATLMVATGSIMILTGRTVSITAAQAAETVTDDVISTMASEHRMALTITERTLTSITFTVADRDGDGAPETIRYAWSGTPGDPLTRKLNAAAPAIVARDVRKFKLAYVTRTEAPAAPVPEVESTTDEVVYLHEGGATASFNMSTVAWCAQSFVPTLSRGDATSWRVTQVQIMGTRFPGATGTLTVRLFPADASGKPPLGLLNPIESKTVSATALPTATGWSQVITFSNIDQNLSPTGRYCIVVSQSTLSATGSVSLDRTSSDANGILLTTGTQGTSWSTPAGNDMRIKVLGRHKRPG